MRLHVAISWLIHMPNCAFTIERAVRQLFNIDAVKVSLIDQSALVKHDGGKVSQGVIFEAVKGAGYDVPR